MRRTDERGQASVLIIGLVGVVAMVVALVVDGSAAYLQRQGLDTLADGAALQGADLGATGAEVYGGGVPTDQLAVTRANAGRAVAAYLARTDARGRFPGLTWTVTVRPAERRVEVRLQAPLDLPLGLAGRDASTSATGSAIVGVDP